MKRRLSCRAATPSVHSSAHLPSSSLSHSSPTPPIASHPPKRVSLAPRSQRASSVVPPSPLSNPTVHEQSYAPTHAPLGPGRDMDAIEEDESLSETVMAVDMRDRGSIGCCYYVAATEKLYLLEDVKSGGLDTIDLRMCTRSNCPWTLPNERQLSCT